MKTNNLFHNLRVVNLLTAVIYVFLYRYIHIHYLVYYFSYFGYYDNTNTSYELILTDAIAIFPIFFYSGKEKASNFISILIYILIYIPTVITIQYYFVDYWEMIPYQLTFMFASILFFISEKFTFGKKELIEKRNISVKFWLIIGFLFACYVFFSYGFSSLRIVALDQVYDVRDDNKFVVDGNQILGYIVLWLTYYFIPLYFAIGLEMNKRKMIIAAIFFALLIYASSGSKAAISFPLFTVGLYFILRYIGFRYLFQVIVALFAVVMIVTQLYGDQSKIVFVLSALLLMRTLSIAGVLGASYIDFFASHPYTYYSHIAIINKITGTYPYDTALGKAVWAGLTNGNEDTAMNANANFLVTDGIAAGGMFGVILISIVFFFLLIYLNKISMRHNQSFVFMLLLGSILSFLNVSLFTTILSCGLFFIIIFFKESTIGIKKNLT